MEMERNSVDRKTKIILPATIHEEYKDGAWVAEVAKVDKEEFSKVPKELVLCEDCKKRNTSNCPLHFGGHSENDTDDDWFCADGERR